MVPLANHPYPKTTNLLGTFALAMVTLTNHPYTITPNLGGTHALGMVPLVASIPSTGTSFHEISVKGLYLSYVYILSLNAFLLYP